MDGVAFEGGKADNYTLEVSSGAFIPALRTSWSAWRHVDGEVNVTFPEQYDPKLAGKTQPSR